MSREDEIARALEATAIPCAYCKIMITAYAWQEPCAKRPKDEYGVSRQHCSEIRELPE